MSNERGIALIAVLLFTSFLVVTAMGLGLMVLFDRMAATNIRASVALLYAADAGIEMTVRELSQLADWNLVLTGALRSSYADGTPGGSRAVPGGGTIDLTLATNLLNCGRTTACTAAQMNANTRERPWGANNPRWQLYAYGPLSNFVQLARPAPSYLVVWVADDSREEDDDALADAVDSRAHGRGVMRVRAEAFGPGRHKRAVEAELVRTCPDDPALPCLPGIRVQSWQEMREFVS